MGYNTSYALRAELAPHKLPEEVIKEFVFSNVNAEICLTPEGDTADAGKWYDHEADLLKLSKAHPHLLFTLEGEGEESGDIWKKYFCAGKIQTEKAAVIIAPFDPGKLVG
jgi:hypothetical protein